MFCYCESTRSLKKPGYGGPLPPLNSESLASHRRGCDFNREPVLHVEIQGVGAGGGAAANSTNDSSFPKEPSTGTWVVHANIAAKGQTNCFLY